MGNQCCGDDSVQTTEMLTSGTVPNNKDNKNINQSQIQISYIDSEGNPLPNAYKRYVKPPTTVGRQSLIVRNLHEHDQVPDWIWAFDNNILSSNNNKGVQKSHQNLPNRKTFQEIQGKFKGVQTVNLSKLNAQPRNLTGSQNVVGFNSMQLNENKIRYTVQPVSYLPTISEYNNPIIDRPVSNVITNPPSELMKRTFSAEEVPIISSVTASQTIPQNYPIPLSNTQSINNSLQQSPVRSQFSVVRY